MSKKPNAIVLGGTVPHKALIEKLKRRGYHTILVDYFDDPPAAKSADEHIKESALDTEYVLGLAKEVNAELVICTCLDQQLVIACYVSEQLGLPTPFDYETSLCVTDKKRMKKMMWENDIPTSKYITVTTDENIDDLDLKFPVMVKPADSNGAAGVQKIDDVNDIKNAVREALKWSRSHTAVIEEFVEGIEISAYNYINNGEATVLLTAQRLSHISEGTGSCIKCFCSVSPATISDAAQEKLGVISNKIAKAFGLKNTPMFYQAIVSGDDVSVIEFSPRLGGGLCFRTIEEKTGFDILEASIDAYLGNDVEITINNSPYYYLIHQVHGDPCIFDHIEGHEQLIKDGSIEEIYLHKNKGSHVDDSKASSARIAAFILKSENRGDLPALAKTAVENIDVYDQEGNIQTNRELYLKEADLLGIE